MRIDAQRNHGQILEAARDLLAESGTRVSVEAIARAAGVGVGTVHRHFPTKERLLDAVLVRFFEPLIDTLDATAGADDAAAGLEQFLLLVVEHLAEHRALAEEMREHHDRSEELTRLKDHIRVGLTALIERGQGDGSLRPDISHDDLRPFVAGLAQAATNAELAATADDRARCVHLVMDAFRTGERRPLTRRG